MWEWLLATIQREILTIFRGWKPLPPDGLNLSAFGVISPPEAGKDKSASVLFT